MPEAGTAPLAGLQVLVTRPAHQAATFSRLLQQAGATVVPLPVFTIEASADPAAVADLADRLNSFDRAIFISANAVNFGLDALTRGQPWPAAVPVAAVGQRTAQALEQRGVPVAWVPVAGFSSEALLELPDFAAVAGQRILIIRGEGGREHLADTLRQRGAEVWYAEVYRRAVPDIDVAPVLADWQGDDGVVTITSETGLQNLIRLAGNDYQAVLKRAPLVVASERVKARAEALGWRGPVIVAANATDDALLAALEHWRQEP